MKDRYSAAIHPFPSQSRRGRPQGTTKQREHRVRDRVRTIATLNHVFLRVHCVYNVSQFSRWFDAMMQSRYPGRSWDTHVSNKWRKNFDGSVALSDEWVQYLNELFPDDRYYSNYKCAVELGTEISFPDSRLSKNDAIDTAENMLSAKAMYYDGPYRLWKAIWHEFEDVGELWSFWRSMENENYVGSYEECVVDLEVTLYDKLDRDAQFSYKDLLRAVLLYRIFDFSGPYEYQSKWGIRVYLCLKIALVGCYPDESLILREIAHYFADLEHERFSMNALYLDGLRELWASVGIPDAPDIFEYGINPFASLFDAFREGSRLHRQYLHLALVTNSLWDRKFCATPTVGRP